MKFNTAIAALMTLTNQFYDKGVNQAEFRTMLQLLSPFAPHMAVGAVWLGGHGQHLCLAGL